MCLKRYNCYLFALLFLAACAGANPQAENDKQQAAVHYKLGVSNLQANNPSLAIKELQIAAREDPQDSSIHAALAQAYQLKKAFPEAERHYLKALELSNNDPKFQNNLGALYLDMGLWDKAIEYFDKAASNLLFLNPYIAITGKGYAYLKKNDLASALLNFQEAISIAPGYARAHLLLSEVFHEQGKTDLERRSLERAVDVAPQYVEAHYKLGVLLLKQNEMDRATKKFRTIMEIAPESDWGQKATDMLRAMGKS